MSRMNQHFIRPTARMLAVTGLLALVFAHQAASAQPPVSVSAAPAESEAIQQQQPAFLVRAEVNHVTHEFQEGETLALQVVSEVDAFLYVLYEQSDGKVFQIFPNAAQAENRVKGKESVAVPAADDPFRWKIGPPFGKEKIRVVASKQPIDELANPALRRERFNPVTRELVKEVASRLKGSETDQWAECLLELTTSPRSQAPVVTGPKRFGVFFGVSKHEFGSELGLDIKFCDHDAQAMSQVLRDTGKLNESQVFVNDHATRANLEQAVTYWLPTVSKPGDTVFIYFSGHGAQIPDDNGDEADNLDEILLPHDFWTVQLLASLARKLEQDQLDEKLKPRVQAALNVIRNAGSPRKAAEMLSRANGVTDDLFGHWLQRLDGRQVVVILDTCMSGGFATIEKGNGSLPGESTLKDKATVPAPFDFLDSEVSRLKDIGQKDTALLAACYKDEVTLSREDLKHGIMTYHLLEAMQKAESKVELNQAFQDIAQAVTNYFNSTGLQALNNRLQEVGLLRNAFGHPFLINNCSKPVYLRP